jgi:hypothetical protein
MYEDRCYRSDIPACTRDRGPAPRHDRARGDPTADRSCRARAPAPIFFRRPAAPLPSRDRERARSAAGTSGSRTDFRSPPDDLPARRSAPRSKPRAGATTLLRRAARPAAPGERRRHRPPGASRRARRRRPGSRSHVSASRGAARCRDARPPRDRSRRSWPRWRGGRGPGGRRGEGSGFGPCGDRAIFRRGPSIGFPHSSGGSPALIF